MIRVAFALWLTCISPAWAALVLPDWQVNSWGSTPTQAHARPDAVLCGVGGFYLALLKHGDGAHELTLPGVLLPDRAYSFSVEVKRLAGDGWLDVFFRRSDVPYEATSIRTILPEPEWRRVTLRGIYDVTSTGAVRVAIRDEGLEVCLRKPALVQIDTSQVGTKNEWQTVPSTFMGIHLNKLGQHNGWPTFDPAIVRMWDTGTTWADLQPRREDTAWSDNVHTARLEYFWRHVQRAPKRAELLMTLGMTPEWAVKLGTPDCQNSAYGRKSCHSPANLKDWRAHVRGLAQRYKGRVRYWEILNEADIGMHWNGSTSQLVAFVAAASDELKQVDPSNVVMGPNVTTMGYRLISDFIRLGGARYVDAFSVHVYVGRSPALSLSKLRNFRELLFNHGLTLPIWNTEVGTSCLTGVDCTSLQAGTPPMDGVSALVQAYLGQAALGIANATYYTWEGGVTSAGGMPLVKSDFITETSAGVAMRQVSRWLSGAQVRWEDPGIPKVRRIDLKGTMGSCAVWWAETETVQVFPSQLGTARYGVDALESRVIVDPVDGVLLTKLPVLFCMGG